MQPSELSMPGSDFESNLKISRRAQRALTRAQSQQRAVGAGGERRVSSGRSLQPQSALAAIPEDPAAQAAAYESWPETRGELSRQMPPAPSQWQRPTPPPAYTQARALEPALRAPGSQVSQRSPQPFGGAMDERRWAAAYQAEPCAPPPARPAAPQRVAMVPSWSQAAGEPTTPPRRPYRPLPTPPEMRFAAPEASHPPPPGYAGMHLGPVVSRPAAPRASAPPVQRESHPPLFAHEAHRREPACGPYPAAQPYLGPPAVPHEVSRTRTIQFATPAVPTAAPAAPRPRREAPLDDATVMMMAAPAPTLAQHVRMRLWQAVPDAVPQSRRQAEDQAERTATWLRNEGFVTFDDATGYRVLRRLGPESQKLERRGIRQALPFLTPHQIAAIRALLSERGQQPERGTADDSLTRDLLAQARR